MSFNHVLITRPEPEAGALAAQLQSSGLSTIVCPGLEFEPRPAGIEFGSHWRADSRKMAVFCSPRAVSFGLRQLPAGFLEGVELAAIGPATASQLEASGLTADILPGPPYRSESLLSEHAVISRPGQVLLFTSPGGRQALCTGMQNLGWDVSFAHVYRAVMRDPGPEAEARIRNCSALVSVWTSSRVLQHLAQHMEASAWNRVRSGQFLVTSERLAKQVKEMLGVTADIAQGPGNTDILASLLALAGK